MNLVILASRFPYPLEKGDKLRLYYQLKILSRTHPITLIVLNEEAVEPAHLEHVKTFCQHIHILRLSKLQIISNLIRGFLLGLPLQVSYFYTPRFKRHIINWIKYYKPDSVYCQLIRMAPYVMDLPIPKILDYQDAFSVGMQRRAERSPFWLKWFFLLETRRLQRYEQWAADRFNHCTIISEQDKSLLNIVNKDQVSVVPNGVDIEFFCPNWSFNKKYDIVFVGNMGYHPNVEAAKYLVKNVLPLLQQQLPNVTVLIAGARPTPEVKNLAGANVHISGWLDDIREAYWSAKLFMAPIFLGSGQQNKILEAMACALPCITTPQVNNAIHASVNETILLAEKAEDFANFAVQLLAEEARREQMGAHARKFVAARFSWQSATAILEQLFEQGIDVGY
ncbi:MAG: glycosyltransferase [Saprospiraceae bacterium]